MTRVLLVRPLCEGDDPEFAEPLGIERLAGYLLDHGVEHVRIADRRLDQKLRRIGAAPDGGFALPVRFETGAAPGVITQSMGSLPDGSQGVCFEEGGLGFFDALRAAYPEGTEPDLVGLSLMTKADVPDARRIASRLRAWWPQARFVAGGVFVTTAPQQAAKLLPAHMTLLQGEGEAALLRMALSDHAAEPEAQPASTRDESGMGSERQTRDHPIAEPFACVDVKPAIAHAGSTASSIRLAAPRAVESPDEWAIPHRPELVSYAHLGCAVNVQTSRGCPGACAFCATPSLPKELRRWSPRSLDLVVDELQQETARLSDAGLPPIFNFVDDDFGPLERLEALADELDARQTRVAFACEMRFAALCRQEHLECRLARLHQAGLTRVFFGIESLNSDTLARWRKPMDLGALPSVLEAFRHAGISVQPGYILWHEDQSVEGALREVRELRELGVFSHRAALSRLIAFPGCAIGSHEADSEGFQKMGEREEAFYLRFCDAARDLTSSWTHAALSEPYAAAQAFLTGDGMRHREICRVLDEVNERSYALFIQMCQQR